MKNIATRRNFINTLFSGRNGLDVALAPDISKVYLDDFPIRKKLKNKKGEINLFDFIESFEPPLGSPVIPTGAEDNYRFTHDYLVTVGAEGYKPEVVLTPPAGSVLDYSVSEAIPTENPLEWIVRVSVQTPPGDEVTENVSADFYAIPVGIEEEQMESSFAIGKIMNSAYGTDINYKLNEPMKVEAKVFDMSGKLVDVLSNQKQPEGKNTLHWNSYEHAAGAYIVTIQAGQNKPASVKLVKP